MSDEITNGELLRAISRVEGEVKSFKYWAIAIIASVFLAVILHNLLS